MMMKIGMFFLCFLAIANNTFAQEQEDPPLFLEDKPYIIPLWHRVADFSPSLRAVESAEISPNGQYVLSGSKFGGRLMLWRAADGYLIWEKHIEAEVEAVTFSPDGKLVAAGDEYFNVNIFNVESGELVRQLKHNVAFDGIAWSPDGQWVAGGSEGGEVVLWNSKNWKNEKILKAGNTVNSLQFSEDMQYLIAAGNKMNDNPTHDWDRHGFVKAWNLNKNWEVIFEINAQEKSSKSVRFSPDMKEFAVAGFANQVKIFSFPEAEEKHVINIPSKVEAVAYHPEGNFLMIGSHESKMRIFKTSIYSQVDELPMVRLEYIHFSKDGRLMATAHEDSGLLSLYMVVSDVQTKEQYHRLSNQILKNKDINK